MPAVSQILRFVADYLGVQNYNIMGLSMGMEMDRTRTLMFWGIVRSLNVGTDQRTEYCLPMKNGVFPSFNLEYSDVFEKKN